MPHRSADVPYDFHLKIQPAQRLAIYRRNVHRFEFWLSRRKVSDPVDRDQYVRWVRMKERPAGDNPEPANVSFFGFAS